MSKIIPKYLCPIGANPSDGPTDNDMVSDRNLHCHLSSSPKPKNPRLALTFSPFCRSRNTRLTPDIWTSKLATVEYRLSTPSIQRTYFPTYTWKNHVFGHISFSTALELSGLYRHRGGSARTRAIRRYWLHPSTNILEGKPQDKVRGMLKSPTGPCLRMVWVKVIYIFLRATSSL